jgi:heat shock protein HslJ
VAFEAPAHGPVPAQEPEVATLFAGHGGQDGTGLGVLQCQGDAGAHLGMRRRQRGARQGGIDRGGHVGRVLGGEPGQQVGQADAVQAVQRTGGDRQLHVVAPGRGQVQVAPVDRLLGQALGQSVESEAAHDRAEADVDRCGLEPGGGPHQQHVAHALDALSRDVDDLGVQHVAAQQQLVIGQRQGAPGPGRHAIEGAGGAELHPGVFEGDDAGPVEQVQFASGLCGAVAVEPYGQAHHRWVSGSQAHRDVGQVPQVRTICAMNRLTGLRGEAQHRTRVWRVAGARARNSVSGPVTGLVLLAALLALTAAACGDDQASDTTSTTAGAASGGATELAGTSWVLADPAAGGRPPTLDFLAGGRLAGSTGCNNVAGTYKQSGTDLTVELGPMTKMACTDPAAQTQEDDILAALPSVTSFVATKSSLELQDKAGKRLLSYEAVSQDLAGTKWTVTGVNNGRNAVETTAQTEQLTAAFGTDGTVSGNVGCNTFTGTYTADGATIAITGLAATTRACVPDTPELDQQYLAALGKATTLKVTGDVLELRDADGAVQVSFRSAP